MSTQKRKRPRNLGLYFYNNSSNLSGLYPENGS